MIYTKEAKDALTALKKIIERLESGSFVPKSIEFNNEFDRIYNEKLGIIEYIPTDRRNIVIRYTVPMIEIKDETK